MELINNKSTKEVLRELRGLKCVAGLAPEALELLASVGVKRIFKFNSHIWKLGEPGEFVAVVVCGLVEIRRFSGRDEEMSMGIFGPSDVIGLSAVMNKKPYPGNAKVLSSGTTVLKVYLRPILHSKDPKAADLHVWAREMFLQHEQVLRDKIDILNAGRVEDRVFEFLSHLVRRFGQYDSKVSCRIPVSLTRSQVGHMVNGRVETIIRTISRWQKAGLVKWKKNEIVIENLPLLEKNLQSNLGLK